MVIGPRGLEDKHFYLLVKIKQRGLVFFQALHEKSSWQVADLKVVPGTGSSNSLVDRGKLVLPGLPRSSWLPIQDLLLLSFLSMGGGGPQRTAGRGAVARHSGQCWF